MSNLPVPSSQYPQVSASDGFPITPSDSLNLPRCTLKLYVGATGDLKCILNNQKPTPGVETLDPATAGADGALSAGNLTYTANTTGGNATAVSLDTMSAGKFYFEVTLTNPQDVGSGGLTCVGITDTNASPNGIIGWNQSGHGVGISADFSGSAVAGTYVNRDGTDDFTDHAHFLITGDVIGVALDLTVGANKVSFYKNGTLVYTDDLTAHGLGGKTWHFGVSVFKDSTTAGVTAANFGATGYAETPPTGFGNLAGPPAIVPLLLKNVAVGFHDLALSRVFQTDTTATELVGLV